MKNIVLKKLFLIKPNYSTIQIIAIASYTGMKIKKKNTSFANWIIILGLDHVYAQVSTVK